MILLGFISLFAGLDTTPPPSITYSPGSPIFSYPPGYYEQFFENSSINYKVSATSIDTRSLYPVSISANGWSVTEIVLIPDMGGIRPGEEVALVSGNTITPDSGNSISTRAVIRLENNATKAKKSIQSKVSLLSSTFGPPTATFSYVSEKPGANPLTRHSLEQITALANAPGKSANAYSVYPSFNQLVAGTTPVRDPNFWLLNYPNFTAISQFNSVAGAARGQIPAVLLTRRHAYVRGHSFGIYNGVKVPADVTIAFIGKNGQVYSAHASLLANRGVISYYPIASINGTFQENERVYWTGPRGGKFERIEESVLYFYPDPPSETFAGSGIWLYPDPIIEGTVITGVSSGATIVIGAGRQPDDHIRYGDWTILQFDQEVDEQVETMPVIDTYVAMDYTKPTHGHFSFLGNFYNMAFENIINDVPQAHIGTFQTGFFYIFSTPPAPAQHIWPVADRGGDSGGANMLIINGELVMISGVTTEIRMPAMQEAINILCGAASPPLNPANYQIRVADLSEFTRIR